MSKYLAVCAMVKNEALYIEEWLEYHLLKGVDHFILWDHNSEDDTYQILKRYESQGLVTVHKAPPEMLQMHAYQQCLKQYVKDYKWIAFIDVDEFIDCKAGIKEQLREYEAYGGVALNWVFYGSSGHVDYSPGLVIDRFTWRCSDLDLHVKSIIQPRLTSRPGRNPHYFVTRRKVVNANREELPANYSRTPPCSEAFKINHYHTKSKGEYLKRKPLGTPDADGVRRLSEDRFRAHDLNHINKPFDKEFINKVENAIKERRSKC